MTSVHVVKFQGEVVESTVTNQASVAEDWIHFMNKMLKLNGGHRIIGMSCKFIRHPISSMSNKTALLQLCYKTNCLILQLLHMDSIPQSLRDFLGDSSTTFVGVDIRENSDKLMKEYEVRVKRVVDVHFLAKRWYPLSYKDRQRPSMRGLAYGIVGFSKRECRVDCSMARDWELRVLDKELIEQASVDAYTSYAIANKLLKDG